MFVMIAIQATSTFSNKPVASKKNHGKVREMGLDNKFPNEDTHQANGKNNSQIQHRRLRLFLQPVIKMRL